MAAKKSPLKQSLYISIKKDGLIALLSNNKVTPVTCFLYNQHLIENIDLLAGFKDDEVIVEINIQDTCTVKPSLVSTDITNEEGDLISC